MNSKHKIDFIYLKPAAMSRIIILCVLMIAFVSQLFPKILTTFPDMVRPVELRVDDSFIYISDQHSVYVYHKNTLALAKRLGNRGEGPQEFKTRTRIGLSKDVLIVYDNRKIIEYSKDLEFLKEMSLPFTIDRLSQAGNNFLFTESKTVDGKESYCFSLYDNNKQFVKYLIIDYECFSTRKFLINPWPVARCWDNKIFISQPHKGFNIAVFNENGEKIYEIEKQLNKIKYEEKHKNYLFEKIRYFLGSKKVKRTMKRARNIPTPEFVPDIRNLSVTDNHIYVKTYDITDKTEKYIIIDLNGNIEKEVFLPIAFMETFTFNNNKFYYLKESDDDENIGWILQEVAL